MKREPITFMGGRRFEGSVSANRKVADLNDFHSPKFKIMTPDEIEEAIALLIEMRDYMAQPAP